MRYLFCLVAAIACNASASECRGFESLFEKQPLKCRCENHPKLPHFVSPYKNMHLAAVCEYREQRHENGALEVHGHFFFRGEQTFTGFLQRKESDFVTEFTFQGEKISSPSPLIGDFVSFRFEDPALAEKEFKAPRLSKKSPCLAAKITFKVKEVLSLPGDSDESGNYVRKYAPLEIGPYRKCTTQ